ncbi:MarR family transcriptional regulator [Salmonella enterica subsp. salamae]|nr:MarR family transcriptional regulator [Salmonella enterica subsp. salamae]SQH40167.1 Uncharacterised protein [Salmonella enterica]
MSNEGGVTIFEFISRNPDLTCAEISAATGRTRESVSRMIGQLNAAMKITRSGRKGAAPTWSVNNFPFGCSNPTLLKFNQLLREVRRETV